MHVGSKLKYNTTPDLMPMIDLAVQLTFFFMLAINFSSDAQSELIRLPTSEIARPSEGALESPISIQTLSSGKVIFGGDYMSVEGLRDPLMQERNALLASLDRKAGNATVIIRADRNVPFEKVQDVIGICQETGFEKFVLRVKPALP
jgi:biopolymer transport protein ExbD